jgi:hypothetical protein
MSCTRCIFFHRTHVRFCPSSWYNNKRRIWVLSLHYHHTKKQIHVSMIGRVLEEYQYKNIMYESAISQNPKTLLSLIVTMLDAYSLGIGQSFVLVLSTRYLQ